MKTYLDKELYALIEKYGLDLKRYDLDYLNHNSPNYGLEKDFGFCGDEAEDFLIEFSEKFNVNLDDFDFEKYFSPEMDRISLHIFKLYEGKKKTSELTINDLKRAIRIGKLR